MERFYYKITVTSQTRWFWAKTTHIQAICHKHEKRRAHFFLRLPKCNPFQSLPFLSIHASLSFCSISFMLFNTFEWLLQCFILLFGHLCVMKLHNFARPGSLNILLKFTLESEAKRETKEYQNGGRSLFTSTTILNVSAREKQLRMGIKTKNDCSSMKKWRTLMYMIATDYVQKRK